jgi:serine/threonine protein kinase
VPLGHEAIPPAIRDLLRTLLAKDPDDRFGDFRQIVDAVQDVREEVAGSMLDDAPAREFDTLSRYVDDPDDLEPSDPADVSLLISQMPAAEDEERSDMARDLHEVVHEWIHDRDADADDRAEHVVAEYANLLFEASSDEGPEEALLYTRKLSPYLQEVDPDRADELEELKRRLEIAVEEDDNSYVDWSRLLVPAEQTGAGQTAVDDDKQREAEYT